MQTAKKRKQEQGRVSSSRFGYFAAKVGCCASRDGWQGDVGGQAGEGLGTCRRVRELAGGGGWRVERGFLDRSARCGGPARLADRVWAHLSWQVRSGQVGLAYGPISNPRIMKRSSPSQLGKCR